MSDSKLDNIIRNFLLLSEDISSQPSVKSRFLALEELLSKVEGKNLTGVLEDGPIFEGKKCNEEYTQNSPPNKHNNPKPLYVTYTKINLTISTN